MDGRRTAALIEYLGFLGLGGGIVIGHRVRLRWPAMTLWACAGVLVAACSSVGMSSNMKPDGTAPPGDVFGSIGTTGDDPTTQLRALQYRVAGGVNGAKNRGEFRYSTGAGTLSSLIDLAYVTPTDFADGKAEGTVFSTRLKPGTYEVYMAVFSKAPMGGFASHLYVREIGPIVFRVEAGRATYLGEFLSRQVLIRDANGVPTDAGSSFAVRDQLTRDRALLSARGADVSASEIINASASFNAGADPIFQPGDPQ